MLKFTPILLAILYAIAMYRFSVWRTARELDSKSTELADGALRKLTDRMAQALDLERIKYWLGEGAQVTDRVSRMLEAADVLPKKERANPNKGTPGKKMAERAEKKAAAAAAPAEEAPAEEAAAE